MRLLSWFWLLCTLAVSCLAIHESDVGVTDWYKQLIGRPFTLARVTAPKFLSEDLLVTTTSSNVLAAISTKDGSVAWRYIFDPEDQLAAFFDHAGVVATLSGPGGAVFRTFDAQTGVLVTEKRLHANEDGSLVQPRHLGKFVAFDSSSKDVYILTNGHTVTRLNDKGELVWSFSAVDKTAQRQYIQLHSTPEALYLVGVTGETKLAIITLAPASGEVIAQREFPATILDAAADIFILSTSKDFVVWVEEGAAKTMPLDPQLSNGKNIALINDRVLAYLVDIGLAKQGHFLAQLMDSSAVLVKLSDHGKALDLVYDLPYRDTGLQYNSWVDANGKAFSARSYWSDEAKQIILDVIQDGKLVKEVPIPFNTASEGIIDHVAFQITSDGQPTVVVTSSSGSIQGFNASGLQWTRPEALTNTILAEFVELPERIAAESSVTKNEGIVRRLIRHIVEAQNLPRYLFSFVKRFVTGSYASATSSATPQSDGLYRDTFGFRQVIVATTIYGKVFGIDSSNGDILWSRSLGLGMAFMTGGVITPKKIIIVKSASEGGDPEVVIVAERQSGQSMTVLYHFNALTGDDVTGASDRPGVIEGREIFHGAPIDTFFLEEQKTVLVVDPALQVHLYPNTVEAQSAFKDICSKLSFPVKAQTVDTHTVTGYKISYTENNENPIAQEAWTHNLPAGEDIRDIIPLATKGPVASLGKVLGNRTTLYKYLNPRLFSVTTVSRTKSSCGLYVLDSAKGTVVYHVEVKAHNGVCDLQASMVENWLVYHYYEGEVADGNVKGSKGYRLVSVEFYEGKGVDQKTGSSDMASSSAAMTDFSVYEEAFVFPHAITSLAPTMTKYGITTKDLLFATKNNKIQSFPRRYLDPRRPHRKPTSEEMEESLIQYDPVVVDDPKRVVSHEYEVANVKKIVTAPALLESTSLVFAFGLDMFLTRVAPSSTFDVLSENFNKVQLVITISALAVAILITRPMVAKKRLREKWYQ